ncbi:MAG: trimethylamine methyltransferase family protein [Gammaproteobacteria bacterium]|nr:trimethylamine methyltransferase family protein [Gammaproteobacteria bacterium]MDH3447778.1 trimethylamine methyltransferase family protein [Gammaproteobacteria bacterium]
MSDNESRARKKRRRRVSNEVRTRVGRPLSSGIAGGRYQPLNPGDLPVIDQAVRSILSEVGMAEAPEIVIDHVTRAGGSLDADGRLHFSADLIEQALAGFARDFSLCGQNPGHDLRLGGGRVHVGSGGAAPMLLDLDSGRYRESTLRDLYDAARLVDSLDNIHFFSRSLVARDMPDLRSLDINTAYACLAGTSKHVFSSVSLAAHVAEVAEMCYRIAGARDAFVERPFLSLNINPPVPPLRFDPGSCEVLAEAVRLGIPVHSNTFGQMGASSPVTMAGTIAQTIAETLSGMIFAWLVNPQSKVIFGTRPMLTDLRTGAMSGGSAEGAVAMAATAQMANYYRLPSSTIAGATDSKLADAQSGYEKCLTVTLAAQAGSNLITQAAGMQASLMGCALESYVIDNDMLGAIMKSLSPIEVSNETLALDAIDEVVHGEGHFLGRPETLERMQSDFVYPEIGDRRSIDEWQAEGGKDIREVARERTRQILRQHYPDHLISGTDAGLRSRFDILLPRSAMEAS